MGPSKLIELQDHFESDIANTPKAQESYKKSEEAIALFQQKFTREKLRTMTLKEYVIGFGRDSEDSFCHWLIHQTDPVGGLGVRDPGYSFSVYYSKEDGAYRIQKGNQKPIVSEDEAEKRLEIIKIGLEKLLTLGEKKDFAGMVAVSTDLPLDQSTLGRILSLYFPDKYLSLYSIRDMDICLEFLKLPNAKQEISNTFARSLEKREILLEFKQKDEKTKTWTNREFVHFLYKEIIEPSKIPFFILRTGGGEYSDQPETKYNFRKPIPGYRELLEGSGKAKFVYIENGVFYGTGKIGKITSYTTAGTEYYDAEVIDYDKIKPGVPYSKVQDRLSKPLTQAGITKISKDDYDIIVSPQKKLIYPNELEMLLSSKKQIIFYGPPGTGKTFQAQRCTEALANALGKKTDPSKKLWEDQWSTFYEEYKERTSGKKKLEIRDEYWKKANDYVLVIDEINRGDISKIFGELVTLLENDKRLGEENQIVVQLPYSNDEFGVPPNLYIIGTMNTADRSIAMVDVALRRRFGFVELPPRFDLLKSEHIEKNKDKLQENGVYQPLLDSVEAIEKINKEIVKKLSRDKQIGHSFFFKVNDEKDLIMTWQYEILPLIEEYFYCNYSDIIQTLDIPAANQYLNQTKGIIGFKNITELDDFLNLLLKNKGS